MNKKEVGFHLGCVEQSSCGDKWKVVTYVLMNQTCPLCEIEDKSILHRFWECALAQCAWVYV